MQRDPFTCWLDVHRPDLRPVRYQPAAMLGAAQIGWQITLGRTRFVYRIPPDHPDIFYIVLIERGAGPRSLRSPFSDLVRLLLLLQRSQAGIRWIRGHVQPTTRTHADALPATRILAFYQRYLTTVSDGVENGVAWYGGDLTTFSWAAEKTKIRRPTPLPPGGVNIASPI